MVGLEKYIIMNNSDKIEEIWSELIVKEKLNTIIKLITKLQETISNLQNNIQQIIQQELVMQWNTSDIPTFKLILEKLNMLDKNKKLMEEKETPEVEIVEEQKSRKEKQKIGFNYKYGFQFENKEDSTSLWNRTKWKRKI